MTIWALILFVVMLAVIVISFLSIHADPSPIHFVNIGIACLIIGAMWITSWNHMETEVIAEARPVSEWNKLPESDRHIYFDEKTQSYFYVSMDAWDVYLYRRNYMNTEKTEEFLALQQEIDKYDISTLAQNE